MHDYAAMTAALDQGHLKELLDKGVLRTQKFSEEKYLGEKPVFDIEVSEQQGLFDLNSFVAHNCKESYLGRGFTQLNVNEMSGRIEIRTGELAEAVEEDDPEFAAQLQSYPDFDTLSKARVKFYDTINEVVVYGPLQVAIVNNFPIEKESFKMLADGKRRLLSD